MITRQGQLQAMQQPGNSARRGSPPRGSDFFFEHDWAATPLGDAGGWPDLLNRLVEFMLDTPTPMFVAWGDEAILLFNQAFQSVLGERWPQALGTELPVLFADIWDNLLPYVSAAAEGQGTLAEDVPLRTWASGFTETRYFTLSCTPVRSEGVVAGVICMCTDTTDKVRAQQQIKRERDDLHALFEQTPGFIAMTEGPEHRFTFANAAYRTLIAGRHPEGLTVEDVMPEVVAQGFLEILNAVYETGQPFIARDVAVTLQTGLHYIDVIYAAVRDSEGRITGLFCEGHDVTERKRAADEVRTLQCELVQVSRLNAVATVTDILAHELNQPLTAITTYAHAAARMLKGGEPRPGALAKAVEAIGTTARNAAEIISTTRATTERSLPNRAAFALHDMVGDAVSLAFANVTAVPHLTIDVPEGLIVHARRVQVQQVLINLLRNALDALGPRAGTGRIRIAAARDAHRIALRVEDNGPGVPESARAGLFDPFRSTKVQGMGLGLSICRTIIEASGGRIWHEAAPGGGAIFCFTLPAA
ncbi:MAG TPA: ATP-binding protein [Allosphingosinicella sp.]|jgi:signal transduction histidine kinase